MPKNKQSNAESDGIPIHVAAFMDAFCRRNLSLNEIRVIALYMRAVAQHRDEDLWKLVNNLPLMVTHLAKSSARSALKHGLDSSQLT